MTCHSVTFTVHCKTGEGERMELKPFGKSKLPMKRDTANPDKWTVEVEVLQGRQSYRHIRVLADGSEQEGGSKRVDDKDVAVDDGWFTPAATRPAPGTTNSTREPPSNSVPLDHENQRKTITHQNDQAVPQPTVPCYGPPRATPSSPTQLRQQNSGSTSQQQQQKADEQVKQLHACVEKLQSQCARHQQFIEGIQDQLRSQENNQAKLQAECSAHDMRQAKLQEEVAVHAAWAKTRIEGLQTSLAEHQQHINEQTGLNEQTRKEVMDLQTQLKHQEERHREVTRRLDDFQQQLTTLEEKIQQLTANMETTQRENAATRGSLTAQLEHLCGEQKSAQNNITNLSSRVLSQQAELDSAHSKQTAQEEKLISLEQGLQRQQQQCDTQGALQHKVCEQAAKLDANLQQLQQDAPRLQQEFSQVTEQLKNNVQSHVEDLRAQLEDLRTQDTCTLQKIEGLGEQTFSLGKLVRDLELKQDDSQADLRERQDLLRKEMDLFTGWLGEHKKDVLERQTKVQKELQETTTELGGLRQECQRWSTAEEDMKHCKRELHVLKRDVADVRERLEPPQRHSPPAAAASSPSVSPQQSRGGTHQSTFQASQASPAGTPVQQRSPAHHTQKTEAASSPGGLAAPGEDASTSRSSTRMSSRTQSTSSLPSPPSPFFPHHPRDARSSEITLRVDAELCQSLRSGDDVETKRLLVKRMNLLVHPDQGGTDQAFQWYKDWRAQFEHWFLSGGQTP